MRSRPSVRDPQSVGPDFGACAVRPRCFNSIIIQREIASYLYRELLDRVRLKRNAFGRIRSDPVCDVIFSHRCGADKWPAEKVFVPEAAIVLQVISLHVFPVRFL